MKKMGVVQVIAIAVTDVKKMTIVIAMMKKMMKMMICKKRELKYQQKTNAKSLNTLSICFVEAEKYYFTNSNNSEIFTLTRFTILLILIVVMSSSVPDNEKAYCFISSK